jgi:glycine cleavage system H protein
MSGQYPIDLLYTKDHEWARLSGNVATIGVTRFAVDQLGDVTQVDLPKEGETFRQGEVVKVNTPLAEAPQNVNEEPFDEGWMIQLELSKPDEVKALMDADAYQDFLKESAE